MRKSTIGEYEETNACRISVTKAIQHAVYEYCDETKSWCGYIRELPGCWAQGNTIVYIEFISVSKSAFAMVKDKAIPCQGKLFLKMIWEHPMFLSLNTICID
ncbi:hypothetical protein FJZ31_07510 [Candidatus Poribacteria bacterium]|nr:hypothetical protein [Candidatus Poribacteria bacterium]